VAPNHSERGRSREVLRASIAELTGRASGGSDRGTDAVWAFVPVAAALATLAVAFLASGPTTERAGAADRDCSDFSSQREAQQFFINNGGPIASTAMATASLARTTPAPAASAAGVEAAAMAMAPATGRTST
jgi:hypothetical protein